MNRLALLFSLVTLLGWINAPAAASPREIELRGTLLCKVEGDARRERAMDGHYLVIVPDGYPGSSEVLDEAGFFRVRLPSSCIDQHVVLKVLHEREEVHLIRVFIERGRLRKFGDRMLYQLGAYSLPGECRDFTGDQAAALSVRNDLRQEADSLNLARQGEGGLSRPVVGGVLGGVLTGLGFLVAPSAAQAGPDRQINVNSNRYGMPPGSLPLYTQFSSSPSLGRTLTSIRMADESVYWNPSSLVRQVGHRVMLAGGEQDEYRATGVYHLPVRSGASFLVPRTLSAGWLGFLDTKTSSGTVGDNRIVTDVRNDEWMLFTGLGFALAGDVSFAVNYNEYHQTFGSEATVTSTEGRTTQVNDLFRATARDVDLSLTWDACHDLRFAAAAYHIAGSEAKSQTNREIPLQRGALGASWVRGNLLVGCEVGLNTGETGASLGLNYRLTDFIGLDLSGGTRFGTLQGGVDLHKGPVTGRARIRTDERHDTAIHLGMGIAI